MPGTLSSWNSAYTASHPNPNLETEKDDSAELDKIGLSPKLLPRVFQEIRLLRADALFNLCLSRFAREMMKDENMYVGGKGEHQGDGDGQEDEEDEEERLREVERQAESSLFHIHAVRADEMKAILQFSEECSYISSRFVAPLT